MHVQNAMLLRVQLRYSTANFQLLLQVRISQMRFQIWKYDRDLHGAFSSFKTQFRFVPGPLAFKLYVAHLSELFAALAIRYSAPIDIAHGTDTPSTSCAFAAILACVII